MAMPMATIPARIIMQARAAAGRGQRNTRHTSRGCTKIWHVNGEKNTRNRDKPMDRARPRPRPRPRARHSHEAIIQCLQTRVYSISIRSG